MPASTLLHDLLATGPFQRAAAPFRLFEVRGPDSGEFLHRLCTQDVLGLADGALRPAAFLDAKGKLQVTCLIGRCGDAFVVETQAEQGERLAALLERYHFTEKLTIAELALSPCVELVGAANAADVPAVQRAAAGGADRVTVVFPRRGLVFRRTYGGGAEPGAQTPLAADRAECLRMVAGLVRVGIDTEPTTLALEADLDDHCSTTKGCYTGQEIVARIHTYGHVNRRLCLLQLAAGPAITAPQPLHDDDQLAVGRVLHAVPLPGGAARLGFGYLPKDFQAPGTRLALADGSVVEVLDAGV